MIYIDGAYLEFGRMKMCHMLADDLLELHEMAAAIGLQRRWFQPTSFPHYDVSVSKRAHAIRLGAKEVGRREIVEVMRRVRAQPWFGLWWDGALTRPVI